MPPRRRVRSCACSTTRWPAAAALHVVRAMRRDWEVSPVSLVLLTASADAAAAARAAQAGADDCVPMAGVTGVLAPIVRNRLERARTQRLAADVDPATRLPHLRSAMPMVERMVSIARRYNHALSILVTEVDGLAALHADGDGESANAAVGAARTPAGPRLPLRRPRDARRAGTLRGGGLRHEGR